MASDIRVGVSVSESADLARLGLVERHLRLALGEVARVVVRQGLSLVYGGHLKSDGYTSFLEGELQRYGRTDRPLRLIVPWSEHRRMTLEEIEQHRAGLGLRADISYLDESGEPIAPDLRRGEAAEEEVHDVPETLTALRRTLVEATDVRVLIGGKESGFEGTMPGVIEEAVLSVQAGKPLFLAGGFGGATATVAVVALGLEERWPAAAYDSHDLARIIEQSGWSISDNGLTREENCRLAVTHRPSEVALLVAQGLQRLSNG